MKAIKAPCTLVSRLSRPRPHCIATCCSHVSFSLGHIASHGSLQAGSFTKIPLGMLVEEETVPNYRAERFYPVELGDVFKSRYRVLAKLGFGTASTVWLCRDLKTNAFVALKICITKENHADKDGELLVSQHIRSIEADHPGRRFLRAAVDDFQIDSSHGRHQCLVFKPMGMTYTNFRNKLPGGVMGKKLVQQSLLLITVGLDFLHQAGVIHTDLSPNNILLGVPDSAVFSKMEQAEIDYPSSRKTLPDRTLYVSHRMAVTCDTLAICDFGAARIGNTQLGDVMPAVYRAPEVIMNMEWDCKIDIWALGVMIWDLLEGRRLFRAVKDSMIDDEQHLAEMVSLMGPPPKEFLQRSEVCRQYWDSEGNWIATTAIPDQSLETRVEQLEGTDKALLLKLARKILRWLPEERPEAQDLFEDEFIIQNELEEKTRTR